MRVPADLALTLATVVEEGSLDGAARALHVSQPAVTQRIQALERIVGQVLLVRSRPVRPTAAGEVLIRYARQVEHLDREAMTALGVESDRRTVVSIGVNADSLATWFLEPMGALADELGVTFDLRRADEDRTASLLADGSVAAAVTTRADPVPGCRAMSLGEMRYVAVASEGFSAKWFPQGVTPGALSSAPVVDIDANDDLQTRYLVASGAEPWSPPRHRIPGAHDMLQAVEIGMGWAVVPTALRGRAKGLVELGGPPVTVALHWQQWRVRSPLLDRIADTMAAEAARVLAGRSASNDLA